MVNGINGAPFIYADSILWAGSHQSVQRGSLWMCTEAINMGRTPFKGKKAIDGSTRADAIIHFYLTVMTLAGKKHGTHNISGWEHKDF